MIVKTSLGYIQICPARGSDGAKKGNFAVIMDSLTYLGGLIWKNDTSRVCFNKYLSKEQTHLQFSFRNPVI